MCVCVCVYVSDSYSLIGKIDAIVNDIEADAVYAREHPEHITEQLAQHRIQNEKIAKTDHVRIIGKQGHAGVNKSKFTAGRDSSTG